MSNEYYMKITKVIKNFEENNDLEIIVGFIDRIGNVHDISEIERK